MTRPTTTLTWGTDATFTSGPRAGADVRVTPADPAQGIVSGLPLMGQHVNYVLNLAGDWVQHIDEDHGAGLFGDGSEGPIEVDGTTLTLTEDLFATDIDVINGGVIECAGFRIFATGTITLSDASRIHCDGADGDNAVGGTEGAGGAAGTVGSVLGGFAGGAGGAGGGNPGVAGSGPSAEQIAIGGEGGFGGFDSEIGASGGAFSAASTSAQCRGWRRVPVILDGYLQSVRSGTIAVRGLCGGTGGGGGSGEGIGGGGGGGAGGGLVIIACRQLVVDATSSISANGGDGGDAVAADGSGGGGGGAGAVLIACRDYQVDGTIEAEGGVGGAGQGTGNVGSDASATPVGPVLLLTI